MQNSDPRAGLRHHLHQVLDQQDSDTRARRLSKSIARHHRSPNHSSRHLLHRAAEASVGHQGSWPARAAYVQRAIANSRPCPLPAQDRKTPDAHRQSRQHPPASLCHRQTSLRPPRFLAQSYGERAAQSERSEQSPSRAIKSGRSPSMRLVPNLIDPAVGRRMPVTTLRTSSSPLR